MDDFCVSVPETATPEFVLAKAKALGVPAFGNMKERNRISVINHIEFFFRTSCIIEFKNGRVASKRVIAAD